MSVPKEDKEKMDVWGYLADSACYISRTLGLKDADDSDEDLPRYRSSRRQGDMRKVTVSPEEQMKSGNCPLQIVEGTVTEEMATAAALAAQKWRQAAEMSLDSLWHKAEEDLDDLWRQMDELTRRYKRLGREARKQTLRADNMSEALGMLLPRVEWLLTFMEGEQNRKSPESIKISDAEEIEILPQMAETQRIAQDPMELHKLRGRWEGEKGLNEISIVDKRLKIHGREEVETMASSEPPFTSISTESSAATFATNTVPSTTTLGSERAYTSVATTTTADTTIKDSAATSWDHFQQPCPLATHGMKQKPLMVLKPALKARTKSATDGKPKRNKKSHPRLTRQHSTKVSHKSLFVKDSSGYRIAPKLHQQPSVTASFPKPARRKSRLFGQRKEHYSSTGSIEVLCDSNQHVVGTACSLIPYGQRIKADSRKTSEHSTNLKNTSQLQFGSTSEKNDHTVDIKPASLHGIKMVSDSQHVIEQLAFTNKMTTDSNRRVEVSQILPLDLGLKHDISDATQNGNQVNTENKTIDAIHTQSLGDTVLRNVKYVSSSSLAVKKSSLKQECTRNSSKKSVQFVKDVDAQFYETNKQSYESSLKSTPTEIPQEEDKIELICGQIYSQISSQTDPENCVCRKVSSKNSEVYSTVEIIKEVHTFRNDNAVSQISSQGMLRSITQINGVQNLGTENIQMFRLETDKNLDHLQNYELYPKINESKMAETGVENDQESQASKTVMPKQDAEIILKPDQNECFQQDIGNLPSKKSATSTQNEESKRYETNSVNKIKKQGASAGSIPLSHKTSTSSLQKNTAQNNLEKEPISFPLNPTAEICTICSKERFEVDLKFENAKQCNSKTLSQFNYQTEGRLNPTDNEPQLLEKLTVVSAVKGTTNDKEIASNNNIAPANTNENRSLKQLRSQMNLSKSDTYCAETASVITFRSHTAITLHPEEAGGNVHQNAFFYKTQNEWKDRNEIEEQSGVTSRETSFLSRHITANCEFLESRSGTSMKYPFESYRNEKCPNVRAKLYSNNLRKKVGVLSSVSKRSRRLPSVYQITTNLDSNAVTTNTSRSSCVKTSDVSLEYCKINLNGKKVNNSPKPHRKSISQSVDISVTPVCCSKKPNPKPLLKGSSNGVDKVDILISIKENSPVRNNQPRSTTTWTNFSKTSANGGGSLSVDSQTPEYLKHEFPRFHIPRICFEAPHMESLLPDSVPPLDIASPTANASCINRIETAELPESDFPNVDIPLSEVSKNELIQKSGISMPKFDSLDHDRLNFDPVKADTQTMVPETVNFPKSISIYSTSTKPVPAKYDTVWSDSVNFMSQAQGSSRTTLNTTFSSKPDSFCLSYLDTTTKMTEFAQSNTSPNYSFLDTRRTEALKSDTLFPDFIRSNLKSDYPISNYLNFEATKHELFGTDDTQSVTPMTDPINIDPIVDPSPADEPTDSNVPLPSSSIPEILKTESSKHESPPAKSSNKFPTPKITATVSSKPEIPPPDVANAENSISSSSRHEPFLQEPVRNNVTTEALNPVTEKCEGSKSDFSTTSAPKQKSPKQINARAELVKFDSPMASCRRSKSPRTAMTRMLSPKHDTNRRDSAISDCPKSMPPRPSITRPDFSKSLRSRSPIISSTRSGSPNYDLSRRKSPRSLSPSTDTAKSISSKPVITKPGNASADSTRTNLRKSDSARSVSIKPDLSICDPSKGKSPIPSFKRLDQVSTETAKAELQRPNSCRPDTSSLDSPKSKSPRSCFNKPDMTTIDSTRPESPMIDSVKPKILKSGSIKSDSICLEATKPDTRHDPVKVETQCPDSTKMKNPRTSLLSSSLPKPDIPNNDTTNPVCVKTDSGRTKSPTSVMKKSISPKSKLQRPVSAKRESPKTDISKRESPNSGTLRTHSPQTIPLRSNSPKPGSVRPTSQKLKSLQSGLPRTKSPQTDSTKPDALKTNSSQMETIGPNNTIPALNLTPGKPEIPRTKSPKSGPTKCDPAGVTSPKSRSTKVESSRQSSPRPLSPKRESPRPILKPGSPRVESLRPGLARSNSPARNSPKPKVSSPISSRSGSPKSNALRPASPKIRPNIDHTTEQTAEKTDEYLNTKPAGESELPENSINTTPMCHDTLDVASSNGSRNKLYRNQSEEKHECAADKLESLERLLDSFLCKGKDNGVEPLRKFENAARHVVDKVTRGEIEKDAILKVQTVLDDLLEVNSNIGEKEDETEPERSELDRRLLGHLPHGHFSGFPPSFDNSMQGFQPNAKVVSPPTLSPYISTRAILRSTARVSVDGSGRVSPPCLPVSPRDLECIAGATKQDDRNSPLRLDHLFISAASASSSSQDSNVSVTSRNGNGADANGNLL